MSLDGFRRQVASRVQTWRATNQGRVAIDDILLGAAADIPADPTKRLSEPSPMLRDGLAYSPKSNARITSGIHGDRANAEAFIEIWGVHHAKPEDFGAAPETREIYAAVSLNNGGRLFVLPKRGEAYVWTPDTPDWTPTGDPLAGQLSHAIEDHMIFGNQELADMKIAINEAISPVDAAPPNPELLRRPRHSPSRDPDQVRTKRWMSDFSDAADRAVERRKSVHRTSEFAATQGILSGNKRRIEQYREYVETRYGPVKDGWDQGLLAGLGMGMVTVAAHQGWLSKTDVFTHLLQQLPAEAGLAGGGALALSYGVKKTVDTVRIFRRRRELRGQLASGITRNLSSAVGIPEVTGASRPTLRLPSYPAPVLVASNTSAERANPTVRRSQLSETARAAFSSRPRPAGR